ncbi:MAG: hypothetical protein R3B90_15105 [Planctomycetaceae bacterium]
MPADRLGVETGVTVRIVPDAAALANACAEDILELLIALRDAGRPATLILPVGPVDQFPILANKINAARLSLRDAVLINMDEYLTDDDRWVPDEHPLSFRSYMRRAFYELLDPNLRPPEEQRVFPDPAAPERIGEIIAERGGVDACCGGIGINGHVAFNEPPEPGESLTAAEFMELPTRVLSLARETRHQRQHHRRQPRNRPPPLCHRGYGGDPRGPQPAVLLQPTLAIGRRSSRAARRGVARLPGILPAPAWCRQVDDYRRGRPASRYPPALNNGRGTSHQRYWCRRSGDREPGRLENFSHARSPQLLEVAKV